MTTTGLEQLPTIVAMDVLGVLNGVRRGASIQLDETYLAGRRSAIRSSPLEPIRADRLKELNRSLDRFSEIEVDLKGLSRDDLWCASQRFRDDLEKVPEVGSIWRAHPGRSFVVPEWLRVGRRVRYGARIYLLRDDDPIEPDDILTTNIDAILEGSLQPFERLQGELHGYPPCCIAFYQDRTPTRPSPEWQAVKPYVDPIERALVEPADLRPKAGVDDFLPFYTREFFPCPGCTAARQLGYSIRTSLTRSVPARLVDSYFCINAGISYLTARAVHRGNTLRPEPGDLGPTHLRMYEPFEDMLDCYADDDPNRSN